MEKSTMSEAHYRHEYWTESKVPTLGWWPWGLIPLIGLLVLFLVAFVYTAPSVVDSEVEEHTREALKASNLGGVTATASGQHVTLEGTVTSESERSLAVLVAENTLCPTWLGDRVCPVDVHTKLSIAAPAPKAAPKVEASTPPEIEKRVAQPFGMEKTASGIVLMGEVPSETLRAQLRSQFEGKVDSIDDQMRVTGLEANLPYSAATAASVALLNMVPEGRVTWESDELSFDAVCKRDEEQGIRDSFQGFSSELSLGTLSLTVLEEMQDCQQEMAALLRKNMILFATGKAAIDARSQRDLKALAEVAVKCPGNLVVEGHTDNVGKPESNLQLSAKRAEAVANSLVGFGVQGTRIGFKGFGDTRPKVENSSPKNRQANRRIEIKVTH